MRFPRWFEPLVYSNLGGSGWSSGSQSFSSVQSLSRVRLCATPWTAARQASLSITNSRSLPKLRSIESMMPSNHLILCCPLFLPPQSFPASGSFQMSQLFASSGQSIGGSASTSVLPMNTQDWFPLGLTGLISLQSKGLLGNCWSKPPTLTRPASLSCLSYKEHSAATNS